MRQQRQSAHSMDESCTDGSSSIARQKKVPTARLHRFPSGDDGGKTVGRRCLGRERGHMTHHVEGNDSHRDGFGDHTSGTAATTHTRTHALRRNGKGVGCWDPRRCKMAARGAYNLAGRARRSRQSGRARWPRCSPGGSARCRCAGARRGTPGSPARTRRRRRQRAGCGRT